MMPQFCCCDFLFAAYYEAELSLHIKKITYPRAPIPSKNQLQYSSSVASQHTSSNASNYAVFLQVFPYFVIKLVQIQLAIDQASFKSYTLTLRILFAILQQKTKKEINKKINRKLKLNNQLYQIWQLAEISQCTRCLELNDQPN